MWSVQFGHFYTWCVTLVQEVLPFPDAWTEQRVEGRHLSDLKGVLAGRMYRRFWFFFLPFLSPLPFLNAFHFSCYPLPSWCHPNYNFHFFPALSHTYKSFFPSVMQDFRSAVTEAEGEGGEPVLEEQRLGEILGVLPQVYALHSSILTELEEHISQW